jgi:hypothetical protein
VKGVGFAPSASSNVLSTQVLNAGGAAYYSGPWGAEIRTSTGEVVARATVKLNGMWCVESTTVPSDELDCDAMHCYGYDDAMYRYHSMPRDVPELRYVPNVFEIAGLGREFAGGGGLDREFVVGGGSSDFAPATPPLACMASAWVNEVRDPVVWHFDYGATQHIAPEFSVEDDGKSESFQTEVCSSSCNNVLGDDDPPPLIDDDSDEEPWFIDTAASQPSAPRSTIVHLIA